MILPTWFDNLGESFSYKEVQFKMFWRAEKTSYPPAENINETPEFVGEGSKEFHFVFLNTTYLTFVIENVTILRFKFVIAVHNLLM